MRLTIALLLTLPISAVADGLPPLELVGSPQATEKVEPAPARQPDLGGWRDNPSIATICRQIGEATVYVSSKRDSGVAQSEWEPIIQHMAARGDTHSDLEREIVHRVYTSSEPGEILAQKMIVDCESNMMMFTGAR